MGMHGFSLAAFALTSALAAAAATVPSAVQAEPSSRFVGQDGYTAMDADRVWSELNDALAGDSRQSAMRPAGEIGPMPVAMLALQASEPGLERVRYRLRHGTDWVEPMAGRPPQAVNYVEVVRFNLGPSIRQELVDASRGEAVGDAEAFGVGPHVGWRFVTNTVMGNRAIISAAGRMELDDAAARAETCLGAPCLSTASAIEAMAPWSDMEPASVTSGFQLVESGGGVLPAAQAIELLLGEIDGIETDGAPGAPAIPDLVIEAVVETNLGQDLGLDSAYRWGGLLDDSTAAIWQRLASFDMGGPEPAVFRASAYECRRGSEFAEPGEYCP